MYRFLFILIFLLGVSTGGFAQRVEIDIFNNLRHESRTSNYKASLEKDIFDDLIFSDSNGNKITLKRKYIELEYGNQFDSEEGRIALFKRMIQIHRHDNNYRASYSVDIFDRIKIEDNRNRKLEIGKDIFGNDTYEEEINGERYAMRRDILGRLIYRVGDKEATLQKDIFDNWIYKDSLGNEFKFSPTAWNRLIYRFETEEDILDYLAYEFML